MLDAGEPAVAPRLQGGIVALAKDEAKEAFVLGISLEQDAHEAAIYADLGKFLLQPVPA
jgi:hypothetical protein